MRNASWFVMFPSKRAPDIETVVAKLENIRGCEVKQISDSVLVLACKAGEIGIGLNMEPHVAEEAREAVEHHGGELTNASEVAAYDARFELQYDLAAIGELFDPLLAAAERLAELTSGIVYESNNGEFQV